MFELRMKIIPHWRLFPWLIAALVAAPVFSILYMSVNGPFSDTWAHLSQTVLWDYILHTLLIMLGVGIGVLMIGIPAAWLTVLCRFPGQYFFDWALLLPIAMPAYVVAYTYTGIFDFSGEFVGALRQFLPFISADWWPNIRSLPGAIGVLVLALYPYIYLLARAAFLEQSVCALEVARTLGYSPFGTFVHVALPLARPAIAAGLVLVLMEVMGDFGTVQYFGITTLATGIYRVWRGLGDVYSAIQIAALLLVFVSLLIFAERRSRGAMKFFHTTGRYRPLPKFHLRGWRAWAAIAACSLPFIAGFFIPALILLHWVILNFSNIDFARFFVLIRHSFFMALFASLIILSIAIFLCYAVRLKSDRWNKFALSLSSVGYALPGTLLAIGTLIPLVYLDHRINIWAKSLWGSGTGLLLTGSLAALSYAYLVRFLAVGNNIIESSLAKVTTHMDDAARSLGLRPLKMLRSVHLPLLKGSLLTALILIFVDILKELPATLILRPFNFDTLATTTFYLASDERLKEAALPSLTIALSGMLPVYLLARTIHRTRPGTEIEKKS